MAGEEDTSFLSQEYRDILKDAENITARHNEQPKMLAFLWSIIADLFGDASKIKGRHNVGAQLKQLKELLTNNYSRDNLSMFFNSNIV